jgi:GNAT superfamily N-acetyltransferase
MSDTIRVAPLAFDDVAGGADLFARAFDADGMARLITPDPVERRSFLLHGGRKQIERAMPYRHVFGAYEAKVLRGIAVWLPPGVTVRSTEAPPLRSLPRLVRLAVTRGPALVVYLRARGGRLAEMQATGGWHLAFLATHPDHQRRGIARRLLQHVLVRADTDGVPAWLETSDPVNPPIYERFGFVTVGTVPGHGTLPTFWFMQRQPRA